MSPRSLIMLGVLGAIWGAAFMLIEIALRGFDPITLIAGRLGSAALALALFETARGRLSRTLRRMRPDARRLALAAFVNTAVPFFLIAWGQQYVDSGIAAILNAAAPLFTVLLAAVAVRSERVGGPQVAGFVAGFAGVVVVVGATPEDGGRRAILGGLAVVAATIFYAIGALYVARRLRDLSAFEVSFGLLAFSAFFTVPPGLVTLPGSDAGWGPVAAVLALGVVATALAFQLYFGLIVSVGAARAMLVTYLVPSLAVVYGVTLLDEPLRWTAVAGLALVLGGVALGTGAGRRRVASPG